MRSQSPLVPHSLAEHIHTGGTFEEFPLDDIELIASAVAYLDGVEVWHDSPDADDLIAALALPDPTLTARQQWERELEASSDLREVVRSILPPAVMALYDRSEFLLRRSQARS